MEIISKYGYFFFSIFIVSTTALLAKKKNRSVGLWTFLGFVGGIVALIIVAALPAIDPQQKTNTLSKKKSTGKSSPLIDIFAKELSGFKIDETQPAKKTTSNFQQINESIPHKRNNKHCPSCKQYYDGFPDCCPFCGKLIPQKRQ